MNVRLLFIGLLLIALTGCDVHARSSRYASAEPIVIERFDQRLMEYIDNPDLATQEALRRDYPVMLDLIGKGILNMKSIDLPGFYEKLTAYYSNPALKVLYKDALSRYDEVGDIEKSLGQGFAYLTDCFPGMTQPKIYMHVSGFNQNVLTGEKTLSLSIDKYLGYDYPMYEEFFYDYQRRKMQRWNVVSDYLTGWLMSEFAFTGKENVLLERMIYAGKIKYLVSRACPELTAEQLMGYTEEQNTFVKAHEGKIWQILIERKHLYTPDHLITNQYFEDQPSPLYAEGTPGNLGAFIGWQIVEQYMKETKNTPEQLMRNDNAQEILTLSRYKP